MKKTSFVICLAIILLIIEGCMSQEEIELQQTSDRFVLEYSTPEIRAHVIRGQLVVGMNKLEVHAALQQIPWDINKTVGVWGIHEQFIYYNGVNMFYLYFENEFLTSWQMSTLR